MAKFDRVKKVDSTTVTIEVFDWESKESAQVVVDCIGNAAERRECLTRYLSHYQNKATKVARVISESEVKPLEIHYSLLNIFPLFAE